MKRLLKKFFVSLHFSLGTAFIGIAVLTSLLLGSITYFSVKAFIREGIRERLRDTVSIAALQIDAKKHRKLSQRSDEASAEYLQLKRTLQNIRNNVEDIRYIYTIRKNEAGKFIFIVDAEESVENISHIGDELEDNAITPATIAAFEPPFRVQVEAGFYTDRWGTWLSSYAPFFASNGKLEGVLGMDMSAKQIIDYEQRYLTIIIILTLACSLVVALLGILFSRRISRPLLQLESEMSHIQKFKLDNQLQINSRVKEISSMMVAVNNMKSGLRSFRKYVPADLVAELITLNKEATLGAEKRNMTVFFSDIADFTSISEKLTPEVLADYLALYFEGMTKIILQNKGNVDKYIGDAIMAFWGAPNPTLEHAALACRAALQCRRFLESFEKESSQKGAPVFRTRMGINSGELIVGNMGYSERLDYTVMGDNVNLASRLEGLNKMYGTQIIISENTYLLIKDGFETRMIDIVAVKGKKKGVAIYELISEKGDPDSDLKRFIDLFNEGMALYLNRKWGEALKIFNETRRMKPMDIPSQMLLERCQVYEFEAPPPEDWDGVTVMKEK